MPNAQRLDCQQVVRRGSSVDHDRRTPDVRIAEINGKLDVLNQDFKDFKDEIRAWASRHESWAYSERAEFIRRIRILEAFVEQVNTPVKVIGWSLAVVLTAMLGGVGLRCWKWLEGHFS